MCGSRFLSPSLVPGRGPLSLLFRVGGAPCAVSADCMASWLGAQFPAPLTGRGPSLYSGTGRGRFSIAAAITSGK